MKRFVVTDSYGVQVGERTPVLGSFATHDEAAEFIGTLPDYQSGRYGLCDSEERDE